MLDDAVLLHPSPHRKKKKVCWDDPTNFQLEQ